MKGSRSFLIIVAIFTLLIPNIALAGSIDNELKVRDEDLFIQNLLEEKNFDIEKTEISYDPVPKDIIIQPGKENYINTVTKEYFIIENSSSGNRMALRSSSAKNFSFDIRLSIQSSDFYINSSTLSVYSTSKLYKDADGRVVNGDYGSTYGITLSQGYFKNRTVSFPINSSQTSTFGSGWNTSKKASVRIFNDGSYNDTNKRLVGNGTVYNN